MLRDKLIKLFKRYLEIKITRKGSTLYFKGYFAGELITEAEVDI